MKAAAIAGIFENSLPTHISSRQFLPSSCMSARKRGHGVTSFNMFKSPLINPRNLPGYFLTGTLAALGVGRFTSAWLMRFVAPATLLGSYAIVNVVLVGFAILHPSWAGLWALFATSFFMSLMFPTIFALGLKGLGPNTKIGGSLIVMAIVGGAILTPLMGLIAEARHTIAPAYIVPLVA